MNFRRVSDAITAPAHGPERRAMPWTAIFTVQFWGAPLVASWPGISLTRLVIVSGVIWLWHGQEAGHVVNVWAAIMWFGLLIGSMAKNSRDLQLGFGSILGRRSEEVKAVQAAAVETRDAAQTVVDKVGAESGDV